MGTMGRREVLRRSLGMGLLASGAGGLIASPGRLAFSAETTLAKLQRTKSVAVGIANEKPYGYVETDGKVTGAIVEVIRATLAPYGVTDIQPIVTNFDTLIPRLTAGRFHIIGAGMYVKPKPFEATAFTKTLNHASGAVRAQKSKPNNMHQPHGVAKGPN